MQLKSKYVKCKETEYTASTEKENILENIMLTMCNTVMPACTLYRCMCIYKTLLSCEVKLLSY